jgi:hypothetical protein
VGKNPPTISNFDFNPRVSAGFVVFSILGYMSLIANKNIADIVKPGNENALCHRRMRLS